jgi:hypothetical protein
MTLCWTVTRRAPRPRIFHTVRHAEHVTRHHAWIAIKVAATITSVVCVGGPLVPYLIPSVPAAVAPGPPSGSVSSAPGVPFGVAPEGSEVGGLVPFLIPTGAGFIPGSGFVPGGGLTPGGGGSFVTPPVTEVNHPPKPIVTIAEPSALSIMVVALVALTVVRFVLLFDRRPLQ